MYHLYSHNDLDGVGCGIIAKCAFGENVHIRYNSVTGLNFQVSRFLQRAEETGNRDDLLFITDLSVNEEIERKLHEYTETGGKVQLIDHHKTALQFNRYPWGMVQVAYEDGRLACATSLYYDYLLQNGLIRPMPALDEFVELVRQYDTWEWEQTGNVRAKRLNDLFFMVSIDEFEEKMIRRLQSDERFSFDEFEEKILDLEEEKIERYVRRKRRQIVQMFVHDRCVGIVHAELYHSELGSELGKDHPHLDYIAILNMGGRRISLRTIHDDIDVSEVAGRFGGGGHAKASGCPLNEEAYQLYVAEPFHVEPIRMDAHRNMYNLKESANGSLYESRNEERFFLFPAGGGWKIEFNGNMLETTYASFGQAERFVKRNYAAGLVRDEAFVKFLADSRIRSALGRDQAQRAVHVHQTEQAEKVAQAFTLIQ